MPVERPERPGETSSGVQSLDRAFGLLERLADAGGSASISELASTTGLPLPTIHRLVRSLVTGGYVRQLPSRRYALGPSLVRLGAAAEHLLADWAVPHLVRVVDQVGESANLAVLDARCGGVRRAGALAALDADVHRGRPPGAAALHRRGQGAAVGPARRSGPGHPGPHRACRRRPSTRSPRRRS